MKKENLHIVICSQLYKYGGGVETWARYFLLNLISEKIYKKIIIYNIKPLNIIDSIIFEFEEKDCFESISVKVKSTKKGSGVLNIAKFTLYTLINLIKKVRNKEKVLFIGTTFVAPIGILLSLFKRKVKIVAWVRSISVGELGSRDSKYVKIAKYLEKFFLRKADLIITNGFDTEKYYSENFPNIKNKITRIENAVNHEFYSDIELPNFSEETLSIAYFGRTVKSKGFPEFIASIDEFLKNKKQNKKVTFHVYGHGDGNISHNNIIYHGKYTEENIKEIIKKYHGLVFLNKSGVSGGISHGLLEAMAAGRLIIAWDNFIHTQVLNHSNSILIQEEDVDGLADFYEQLSLNLNITRNDLRLKCKLARKDAEKYSVENHIERFLHVTKQLK